MDQPDFCRYSLLFVYIKSEAGLIARWLILITRLVALPLDKKQDIGNSERLEIWTAATFLQKQMTLQAEMEGYHFMSESQTLYLFKP